jgi:hypothetical protein
MGTRHAATEDPLDAPVFSILRMIHRALARGGTPPLSKRAPEDEARIAAYRALQLLLQILEAFRKACIRGRPVRLVVNETGMSPRRVLMTIAVVQAGEVDHE